MRPAVLAAASEAIADHFRASQIDVIHGIPHGGNYLATAVALAMAGNIRLHASRKDQNIPTSWKEVYHQEVRSFTLSGEGAAVFAGVNLSFVRPGERVLLVDDVCASGETGSNIITGLMKRGVSVAGFAVMFDKMFQGGLERIARLGIDAYSCVRVKEITQTGQIEIL
jgi:adenine/guanine phosphoribosyltransferase-like PRPP-binding protein